MKRRQKKQKRNRTKQWIVWMLVLVMLGSGAYAYRESLSMMAFDVLLADQVEKTLAKSYAPLAGEEEKTQIVEVSNSPFSLLLLGVDQRDHEPARSDMLMYTVVRPKDSQALLISIPRDTYTDIIGKDKKDKINHAYAFGGEKMAKDTVENLLGNPVQYYAAVNFKGVRDAVDALGGIELPITKDIVNKQEEHEKFTVEANKPIYNGTEALNYVRYREDSDFQRTGRQQIFMSSLVNRMLSLEGVTNIPTLIDIMGDNFKTDIPPSLMIGVAKQMLTGDKPQFQSFTIMGEGTRINKVYYNLVNEEDLSHATKMIENWLDPDTTTEELLVPSMFTTE